MLLVGHDFNTLYSASFKNPDLLHDIFYLSLTHNHKTGFTPLIIVPMTS